MVDHMAMSLTTACGRRREYQPVTNHFSFSRADDFCLVTRNSGVFVCNVVRVGGWINILSIERDWTQGSAAQDLPRQEDQREISLGGTNEKMYTR